MTAISASLRRWAVAIGWLLALSGVMPAQAQIFPAVDERGVDVVLGKFNYAQTDVAIGQPASGGLAFTRFIYSTTPGTSNSVHDYVGYITRVGGTQCHVVIGRMEETFTIQGTIPSCEMSLLSDQKRGSQLHYNSSTQIFTYTRADGTVALFGRNAGIGSADDVGHLKSITTPDGLTTTLSYTLHAECYPDPDNCSAQYQWRVLDAVTNNVGYALTFSYDSNGRLLTVWGINRKDEFCSGADCAPATPAETWPSVTYGYDSNGNITSALRSPLGVAMTYSYDLNRLTGIQFPDHADHDVTISYDSSLRVHQVNLGFGTWTYTYDDTTTSGKRWTTVTNPDATTRKYLSKLDERVESVTNELNQTTAFEYDSALRETKVKQPEGNYAQLTYDARGNVTETRVFTKIASSSTSIVTSAGFDSVCGNPKTCNKPNWTMDARGFRTDFTYNATHGGIETITSPAPSGAAPIGSGSRPQVRYGYTQHQARYWSSSSTQVNGGFIWRQTSTSSCATGVAPSCVGTADETRATVSYPIASTLNNLLPTSTSTAAGNSVVSATTSMTYTKWGDVETVTTAGGMTRYYYDLGRRLTGTVAPDADGASPTLTYRAARTTYNLVGQPMSVEQGTATGQGGTDIPGFGSLAKQEAVYDSYGRAVVGRVSSGSTILSLTQTNYDSRGRARCTAVRMNPTEFGTSVDACDLGAAGGNGSDRISRNNYDAVGRMLSSESAVGTTVAQVTVAYTYTTNGKVQTIRDARNYPTTFEYDEFDRLWKKRYPNPGSTVASSTTDFEEFLYDTYGRLDRERRRGGGASEQFEYGYDNLGRITSRNAPGSQPDVSYGYDFLGRMTSSTQSGNSITNHFDALSRLTSTISSVTGTVGYGYDSAGRRNRLDYPGGFFITYDYNAGGDLTVIRDNNGAALGTYAYDNLGRRLSLTRANGAVTSFQFTDLRLSRIDQTLPNTTYNSRLDFSYNPVGQVTSRTRSDSVYEPVVPAGSPQSYAANGLNQYTSALGATPTYDVRGNLTGDGTKTFGYDFNNRLTSASGSVTLSYDPASRLHEVRVSGTVTSRFVYDGAAVIAETDGSGNVLARHVHGPGTDEPLVTYASGTRRWPITDERGSVIGLANDSGTTVQVNKYDPYGVPDAGNQGRFQFTGQMWLAEVGLYHYKARVYHPRLGRFLQTDPIGYEGGMNLYGYVGGDPVNFSDPSGLFGCFTLANNTFKRDSGPYVDNGQWVAPVTSSQDFLFCTSSPFMPTPYSPEYSPAFGPDPESAPAPAPSSAEAAAAKEPAQCLNDNGAVENDNLSSILRPNVIFGGIDAEGYALFGVGFHLGGFYDRSTKNYGMFFAFDVGGGMGASGGVSGGVAKDLSSFQGTTSVLGGGVGAFSANYATQQGRLDQPVAVSVGFGGNSMPPLPVPASVHTSKSYTHLFLNTLPDCKQ